MKLIDFISDKLKSIPFISEIAIRGNTDLENEDNFILIYFKLKHRKIHISLNKNKFKITNGLYNAVVIGEFKDNKLYVNNQEEKLETLLNIVFLEQDYCKNVLDRIECIKTINKYICQLNKNNLVFISIIRIKNRFKLSIEEIEEILECRADLKVVYAIEHKYKDFNETFNNLTDLFKFINYKKIKEDDYSIEKIYKKCI